MRDIKFRAWHKDSSRWIENFALVHTGSDEPKSIEDVVRKRRQEVRVFEVNYEREYEGHGNSYHYNSTLDSLYGAPKIENVILQQYTGLKDKNGKKIYEGDIVDAYDASKNETFSGNVIYDLKLASYVIIDKEGDTYYLTSFDLQVVGNIFENTCCNFVDTI